MLILEKEYKFRNHDKKWMLLGKILDHDNMYKYTDEDGNVVKYIPQKWIILNVYDFELEIIEWK